MTVLTEIEREGRVIVYRFVGNITLKEIQSTDAADAIHRDKMTPHKVHTLLNFLEVGKLPTGILAPSQRPPAITHPNSGYVILISNSTFVNAIAAASANLTGMTNFRYFKTADEAWVYIDALLAHEKQI